jgi:hypothetical protein
MEKYDPYKILNDLDGIFDEMKEDKRKPKDIFLGIFAWGRLQYAIKKKYEMSMSDDYHIEVYRGARIFYDEEIDGNAVYIDE